MEEKGEVFDVGELLVQVGWYGENPVQLHLHTSPRVHQEHLHLILLLSDTDGRGAAVIKHYFTSGQGRDLRTNWL